MRFSTIAILATGAVAGTLPEKPHHSKKLTTSTVYATVVKTVSECPPEVTKCPYDHNKPKVTTVTVSSYTTVCTVDDDDDYTTTKKATSTSTYKPHTPTSTPCDDDDDYTHKPKPTGYPTGKPEKPEKPEEPKCPYTKVETITSSYTTVLPTVIYKTVVEDCKPAKPTGGYEHHGNGSSPAKPTKPVQAGAGSVVGSVFFAAAAGVAAFAFA